jgi:hypothetical protein
MGAEAGRCSLLWADTRGRHSQFSVPKSPAVNCLPPEHNTTLGSTQVRAWSVLQRKQISSTNQRKCLISLIIKLYIKKNTRIFYHSNRQKKKNPKLLRPCEKYNLKHCWENLSCCHLSRSHFQIMYQGPKHTVFTIAKKYEQLMNR